MAHATPTPSKTPIRNILIGYQAEDGTWQKYATWAVEYDEGAARVEVPVGPFPLAEKLDALESAVDRVLTEFACTGVELTVNGQAFRVNGW